METASQPPFPDSPCDGVHAQCLCCGGACAEAACSSPEGLALQTPPVAPIIMDTCEVCGDPREVCDHALPWTPLAELAHDCSGGDSASPMSINDCGCSDCAAQRARRTLWPENFENTDDDDDDASVDRVAQATAAHDDSDDSADDDDDADDAAGGDSDPDQHEHGHGTAASSGIPLDVIVVVNVNVNIIIGHDNMVVQLSESI